MTFGKLLFGGLVVGTGAYVAMPSGSAGGGEAFAQPAAVVIARVTAEPRVVEGSGMGSLTLTGVAPDAGGLLVRVKRAGDTHIVDCRVAVTPVSAQASRAAVDCTPQTGSDAPMRRLGVKALDIVVREHVAASVAARPYDTDAVADRMMALLALNAGTIATSLAGPPRDEARAGN